MPEKTITVIKGEGCIAHNNREYSTPNVDSSLTCNNITYIKIPLEDAYEICFGESIREYDNKQTRNDRKIGSSKNYLDSIIKKDNEAKSSLSYKKKGITKDSYEIIYQIGNRNDTGYDSEDSSIVAEVLNKYALRLQEENPHIYIYNLVMHKDEPNGTFHLHSNFIPLGTGYSKGLSVRNSLRRALENQGVSPKEVTRNTNHTTEWHKIERIRLKELAEEFGLLISDKVGTRKEHYDKETYIAKSKMEEELEKLTKLEDRAKEILNDDRKTLHNPLKTKGLLEDIKSLKYELLNQKDVKEDLYARVRYLENVNLELKTELKKEMKLLDSIIENPDPENQFIRESCITKTRESLKERKALKEKLSFIEKTLKEYAPKVYDFLISKGIFKELDSSKQNDLSKDDDFNDFER